MEWQGLGSIAPGAPADFCVLDRNPLTCAAGELVGTQVLRTVFGGRDIYDTGVLPRLDDAALAPERVDAPNLATAWRRQGGHVCTEQCPATHRATPAAAQQ